MNVCRVGAEVQNVKTFGRDGRHVVVVQIDDFFRMRDNGVGVAGDEIFVLADADDERRTAPRADNRVRTIRANDGNPIGADDFSERVADGWRERIAILAMPFFVIISDEMREDFRVRVGFESVSGFQEFLLERVVIFDDAVVDDGDFAGLIEVRVGIFIGRNAVGGPARVADAESSGDGFRFQETRDAVVNFALPFAQEQAAFVQQGNARAVVAAIFQPAQSFEQDGRGRLFSDVSNDATHVLVVC